MKKTSARMAPLCFAVFLLVFLSLCSCGKTEEGQIALTEAASAAETALFEPDSLSPRAPVRLSPADGEALSLLNDEMTAWIGTRSIAELDALCDFTEKCGPVPVVFRWDGRGAERAELVLSESPDLKNPLRFSCEGEELAVEDLLPGRTYYWRVEVEDENGRACSETRSFTTKAAPRTVSISGMSNVRDLGGKITSSGKKVRYGMVFRGADLSRLTQEGIEKAVGELGIKTELDLRARLSGGVSPFGNNVRYLSVTAPYYEGIAARESRDELRDELLVFADADNYPIYFHCSIGRDRTGTLAFLLLALLGVEEDEIDLDYELSFFSSFGGYVASGAVKKTPPSEMIAKYGGMKAIVSSGNKGSLCENAELFVKKLGLKAEDVEAIRSNLLE